MRTSSVCWVKIGDRCLADFEHHSAYRSPLLPSRLVHAFPAADGAPRRGRSFKLLRWQVESVAQFDDITTRTDFPDQMLVMPPEGRLGDAIKLRGLANAILRRSSSGELGGGLRFQHGRDDAAKSLTPEVALWSEPEAKW
jgi:hypothetical protein